MYSKMMYMYKTWKETHENWINTVRDVSPLGRSSERSARAILVELPFQLGRVVLREAARRRFALSALERALEREAGNRVSVLELYFRRHGCRGGAQSARCGYWEDAISSTCT